jgi:hypothetical protein
MKIKINYNNNQLYCIYSKEQIEIDEKYVEIIEDYLGDEIIKTYKYIYLDMLVDDYIENYDTEPEILGNE